MTKFNVVLYEGFETIDAYGPAEVVSNLPNEYELGYFSFSGDIIGNRQNIKVYTSPFSDMDTSGILLIPGGFGARALVNDEAFIEQLKALSEKAPYVLTVCTGSALLAKTGLLDGLRATSNKMSFEWACSNRAEVQWIRKARWVKDGKFYTSSGLSAGIDMTLGFVGDLHGLDLAHRIAAALEYTWHADADYDPFAIE
jgi:transcriptional regulator GlxA family with amidase domain